MLKPIAKILNYLGNSATNRGRARLARASYTLATRFAPQWSSPWYNLGFQAKYRSEWTASLEYNQKAAALDPEDEASWWNLGIAATAVRDWAEARRAWRGCGIELDEGTGEVRMPGVSACVRLNPNDSGEVVWGTRLDPARIQICNVPLPASKRRFGDILLNDGAAEGTRLSSGEEYPVFNELALWHPSAHNTFESDLALPDGGSVDRLVELCCENDVGMEDWGTIRFLCAECSRGSPGPHQCTAEPKKDRERRYGFGAIDREVLLQVLTRWVSEDVARGFTEPTLEVASAPDA